MPQGEIEARLERGIAASKAGEAGRARDIFFSIIELDQYNEQAWLWLSSVVETMADKRVCLENVLFINPSNAHAATGLQRLYQQPTDQFALPPSLPRLDTSQASSDWEEEEEEEWKWEGEEEEEEGAEWEWDSSGAGTTTAPTGQVCPRCDYRNPSWALICDRCGADLQPVDVRQALGLVSWQRTLMALVMAVLFAPVWRAIISVGLELASAGGESGSQLAIAVLDCAVEALLPGLVLALIGVPITLLTWVGARLVGGKQSLKTHVQLTTVAFSSWVMLFAFLAPFASLVPHLLGNESTSEQLAAGTSILIGVVVGLMGIVWLTQATRTVHSMSGVRAILVTLLVIALGAALLFGLDLLTSEWFSEFVNLLTPLFQLCLG